MNADVERDAGENPNEIRWRFVNGQDSPEELMSGFTTPSGTRFEFDRHGVAHRMDVTMIEEATS